MEHVAGLPQRQHLRSAHRRSGPRRSARAASVGPGAPGAGPGRGAAAARRAAPAARPGLRAQDHRCVHHGHSRRCGRHDQAIRRTAGLPLRGRGGAAGEPVHHAAAGELCDTPGGGGPAAHRGRSPSAALCGALRHPAHRRAHRHGPDAQSDRGAQGPPRPVDHGGRDDRRPGSPGRDDGVLRRAVAARRHHRRVAEPARQPAEQSVRPPGAERPAAHRRAHPLSDRRGPGQLPVLQQRHSPVRRRAHPLARHAYAALRVRGRDAARRRAVRRRGRLRARPVHHGVRPGAVAAPYPDARAAVPRRAAAARPGDPLRRPGRQSRRQVGELAGARRAVDGRLRLRDADPARPLPALAAASVGGRGDPRVRARAVRDARHLAAHHR